MGGGVLDVAFGSRQFWCRNAHDSVLAVLSHGAASHGIPDVL